jgi:hypothetical protein
LFLNQEQERRNERNEFNQKETRITYFRSYNQKPQRKEYLKEYRKVRQLIAKYNPLYQNQRKTDRHKLSDQDRYRIKILTQEVAKRG